MEAMRAEQDGGPTPDGVFVELQLLDKQVSEMCARVYERLGPYLPEDNHPQLSELTSPDSTRVEAPIRSIQRSIGRINDAINGARL